MYSISCIQRPPKGSNKSGLLKQVVLKRWFYLVDFRRGLVSEQWSLKSGGCLIWVVSNTGLTVFLVESLQIWTSPKFNPFLHINYTHFNTLKETFGKHCGKGEIAQNEQFHLFLQCFLCNRNLKIL